MVTADVDMSGPSGATIYAAEQRLSTAEVVIKRKLRTGKARLRPQKQVRVTFRFRGRSRAGKLPEGNLCILSPHRKPHPPRGLAAGLVSGAGQSGGIGRVRSQ